MPVSGSGAQELRVFGRTSQPLKIAANFAPWFSGYGQWFAKSPNMSAIQMPKITYAYPGGHVTTVDVAVGENVMRSALYNDIEGIAGECGGACSCATCHVYIDDAWMEKAGVSASDAEAELLEGTATERTPASRLSCQIVVTDELGGLIVHMPERQY